MRTHTFNFIIMAALTAGLAVVVWLWWQTINGQLARNLAEVVR